MLSFSMSLSLQCIYPCCVQLFETPWTVDCQSPLPMQFFRQNYWSGLLFPPPGDLPHPGIEPTPPVSQAGSLPLSQLGSPVLYYTYKLT